MAFIGRGRTLAEAAAFDPGATLSGTEGFTLDPILSLRRVVRVPSGKKVQVIFWTIAAPSREEVDQAIDRYRHPDAFNHELIHAWTRAQVEMRHVGITSQQAAAFQHLGRYLVYPETHLRVDPETVRNGLSSQRALWPLSISGDNPIFAVRINDDMDIEIVREALSAQEYLRRRGIVADLAIMNERPASYAQDMQHAVDALSETLRGRQNDSASGQVYAVRRDLSDETSWNALLAAARVVFHARNGKLVDQINRAASLYSSPRGTETRDADWQGQIPVPLLLERTTVSETADDLDYWNGYGGFTRDGREYVIRLAPGQATPQPWINVIANDSFGFHVSAEGGGFTWSTNSRDYQLTQWSNDPVIDRPSEAFYVADIDNGEVYAPFAALNLRQDSNFETRHGLGYSSFHAKHGDLETTVIQTVACDEPVKLTQLTITNNSDSARRLRVYGYLEWVLGNDSQKTAPFVMVSQDAESGALLATNPYSIDYSGRFAVFSADLRADAATANRREFIGRNGCIKLPQAVARQQVLTNSMETEGDPCAALSFDMEIGPGESRDITFLLGDCETEEEAKALLGRMATRPFSEVLGESTAFWKEFTGRIQVDTPDAGLNHIVNAWLPYQTLGCRMLARAGFYQASGAFGFRDQLQDSLGLLIQDPTLARGQILNAAARQFVEGDVQHWWLPKAGAGVRTTISDDVVWLAYAIDRYIESTGDEKILIEQIAFLKGPSLTPGQHDAFFQPEVRTRLPTSTNMPLARSTSLLHAPARMACL